MSKCRLPYRRRGFDRHRSHTNRRRRRATTDLSSSEEGINEGSEDERTMTAPIIRSLKKGIRFNSVAPLLSARAKQIANRILSRRANKSINDKYDGCKITFIAMKSKLRSKNSNSGKKKSGKEIRRNIMWIRAKDGRLHRKREKITSKVIGIAHWVEQIADRIQDTQVSDRHSIHGTANYIPQQHYRHHRTNTTPPMYSSRKYRSKSTDEISVLRKSKRHIRRRRISN